MPNQRSLHAKTDDAASLAIRSASDIRADLLAGREIALLDVREEAIHATGHPLFAANLSVSRIELEAYERIPRLSTPIVVFGDGEGLANKAAGLLQKIGYLDVKLLQGSLQGWRDAGYELFQDVNAPSKAFGELLVSTLHTPSLSAQQVQALINDKADMVLVDVRRYDEFQTMSIPTAISVPGGEVVLRVRDLAPNPQTRVIVNCAGRTRSILGTQSLINARLPNPVFALRNGTIGWTLANQSLRHGETASYGLLSENSRRHASESALRVAQQAGVGRTDLKTISSWIDQDAVTVYRFDVRSPREYVDGHLPGFLNAPGGQLVQETDFFAPVRGARITLADDDGTRANMTASWLAQMGWNVSVVDRLHREDFTERGSRIALLPSPPEIPKEARISSSQLRDLLSSRDSEQVALLDFSPGARYAKQHIPGAWFALRSQLTEALQATQTSQTYVLCSDDGIAAQYLWSEVATLSPKPVFLLEGGADAWQSAGLSLDQEPVRLVSPSIDRYRRPYEGADVPRDAIQAYLDWEYGLVAQLQRDGTHGFSILKCS